MNSKFFIRGITLLGFIVLIASFLFYRTGGFDTTINNNSSPFQTSPNGAVINNTRTDTLKPKDSLERLRLSSSKSFVLIDQKQTRTDSSKNKYKRDDKQVKREMLPGSKSAYVFRPRDPVADSLRKDSLIKQMLKRKQQ